MRTKAMWAVLSSTAILAACAPYTEIDGVRLRCANKQVNVINLPGRIEVRPERIEVCRGFSLALRFRNSIPTGSARTKQPATGANWLDKENTNSMDEIVIVVDMEAMMGAELKYTLEIDGLGVLDPRIVIQ